MKEDLRSDEMKRIERFDLEVQRWLIYIPSRFADINDSRGLTPEDKKRLKEYYLETCVTPRIREAVKKYFPEEFETGQRAGNPNQKRAS